MFLKILCIGSFLFLLTSYTMEKASTKRKADEYLTCPDAKKIASIGQLQCQLLPGVIYVCRFITIDRQRCNQVFDTRGKIRAHLRAIHQISGNIFERYCTIEEKNS